MAHTILHAADLHLDSKLHGLSSYEGAPVDAIRIASRRALENLVATALDRRVSLVLLAGDIFDGDHDDYNTALFFANQMARLGEADIPVVLISGNHDAASRMTRTLRLPGHVTTLSVEQPDSVRFEDLGVVVHGQGFATPAVMDNLALAYPPPVAGMFNIGLLHSTVDGAEGHDPYAPCRLVELRDKRYQYWALGHIHKRQVLCEDPWVIYPGNLQGRHIRETGSKGCTLIHLEDATATRIEHVPLDVFRWERCRVAPSAAESPDEVLAETLDELEQLVDAGEGRPLGIRVELSGPCPAHMDLVARQEELVAQLRADVQGRFGQRVWLEKIRFRTQPPREDMAWDEPGGPLEAIAEVVAEYRAQPEKLEQVLADKAIRSLKNKLSGILPPGGEPQPWHDAAALVELLDGVVPYLKGRLRRPEGS